MAHGFGREQTFSTTASGPLVEKIVFWVAHDLGRKPTFATTASGPVVDHTARAGKPTFSTTALEPVVEKIIFDEVHGFGQENRYCPPQHGILWWERAVFYRCGRS